MRSYWERSVFGCFCWYGSIFMIMFAILGTQLFSAKGDLDDERLNFRDFFSSVVTLFVVSTGENTFEVAWGYHEG